MTRKNKKILEEKKSSLKQIVLNSKFYYDSVIYRLLNTSCLDSIIMGIDDIPVACDVNEKELTSAEEQFIALLDRLISYFRDYFYKIHNHTEIVIETICHSQITLVRNYLLSKHYLGDNKYIDFFNESIWRILVSNFIDNGRTVPEVKALLKSINIKYKKIDLYSISELKQIIELLSNLVLCSDNSFKSYYLFGSIDCDVCKKIEEVEQQVKITDENIESIRKSSDYFYKHFSNYYSTQYSWIIKDYNKKIKYLKYFK